MTMPMTNPATQPVNAHFHSSDVSGNLNGSARTSTMSFSPEKEKDTPYEWIYTCRRLERSPTYVAGTRAILIQTENVR